MLEPSEYIHLAMHAKSKGDLHAAMLYLKDAIAQEQENTHAKYLLALIHAELGLLGSAAKGMKECLAINPLLDLVRYQLAMLCLQAGDTNAAREAFVALRSSADGSYRLIAEALIYVINNQTTQAKEYLTLALSDPALPQAMREEMQNILYRLLTIKPPAQPAVETEKALRPEENKNGFLGAYKQSESVA